MLSKFRACFQTNGLEEGCCRSVKHLTDRTGTVSITCILNPTRPTLTNVLQIRKIRLFVSLLMFYRSQLLGFARSQNVLQIRTPWFSFFQMFYRSGNTVRGTPSDDFYSHSVFLDLFLSIPIKRMNSIVKKKSFRLSFDLLIVSLY